MCSAASPAAKEAWRCDPHGGANVISIVPNIFDHKTLADSFDSQSRPESGSHGERSHGDYFRSGTEGTELTKGRRKSKNSGNGEDAYKQLLAALGPEDGEAHGMNAFVEARKEEVKVQSTNILRARKLIGERLEMRRRVFPIVVVALPALELLAVHSVEREQEDSDCPLVLFTICCEAFLMALSLAVCAIECSPQLSRLLGHAGDVFIKSLLVWCCCCLLTLSSPAHRCHLLGYRRNGDYDAETCSEGIMSQWVALLLGFVAISQQLPFLVFAPLSQLICLQHLVMSAVLPCPGTNSKWNPAIMSALQLHVLAGQFAIACWRFNAEDACASLMHDFVENTQKSHQYHTDVENAAAGWLEQLMLEMATEDVHCRQLVVNLQKVLPASEITLDLTSLLTGLADYVSKWVVLLDGKADILRSIGANIGKSNNQLARNHVKTVCAMGGRNVKEGNASGIEAFVNQAFLPTEVAKEDEAENEDLPRKVDDLHNAENLSNMSKEVSRPGQVILESEAKNGQHCPKCWKTWANGQEPASGFCDVCLDKQELADGMPAEDNSGCAKNLLESEIAKSLLDDRREFSLVTDPARREQWSIGEWPLNALQIDETEGKAVQIVGFELLKPYKCLDRAKLCCFLKQLEDGYDKDNPYHTQVHAGDVCNSIFFLTTTIGLFQELTDTKRVALMLAALGHDLGHFGRNNMFLIKNRHNLATTYNDRSVLENFHCATLFRLLEPDRNIGLEHCRPAGLLSSLSSDTNSKARVFIIALILATDTQHHLEDLTSFNLKLDTLEATGDFDCLLAGKDQQDILCFLFRSADIGHSAKPWRIHEAWSLRVSEEFHRQGDEEIALGIPISPLCDRRGFVLSTSQMGFLRFICLPTWTAVSRFETMWRGREKLLENLEELEEEKFAATELTVPSRSSSRKFSWDTRHIFQNRRKGQEDLRMLYHEAERKWTREKRSVQDDCFGQCQSNFEEWEKQSQAHKKDNPS